MLLRLLTAALVMMASLAHAAADVALVTSLQGKVSRSGPDAAAPVEAFVKLKLGDLLTLDKGAKVQITYFENGRQESWIGGGKLEVAGNESKATGLAAPLVKQVPLVIVKQLARTPTLDSQGRAGVMRLRAIPTPEAIAKIETTYQQMRAEAGKDDLNPELYLLAGMLELRDLDRVETALKDLESRQKDNVEAKILLSLYKKALSSARQSK